MLLTKIFFFIFFITSNFFDKWFLWIYRGYYTVARRYEFNLYSSGKNNISWVSAANEWDIALATSNIKIHIFELTCKFSFCYINILITAFLTIFRRFPTTFRRFSKIFQKCPENQTNVPEHFPRISENFRRLPKTFEEDPKMFRWYTNKFKYNLRDKPDVTEIIDIFTCEDIVSFLSICYHSLYLGQHFQDRGHSFSLYGPT